MILQNVMTNHDIIEVHDLRHNKLYSINPSQYNIINITIKRKEK